MDDQAAHVSIAAFADAKKGLCAPGRMLCGHQAQPCGKIARFTELASVARRCDKSRCAQATEARDRDKSA